MGTVLRRFAIAVLGMTLIGCGGSSQVTIPPATTLPVVTPGAAPPASTSPQTIPVPSTTTGPTAGPSTYAVVLVEVDDVLNVRSSPLGSIIDSFDPTATGIVATGATQMAGSQEWVEVVSPAGTGWVNGRYLTPEVAAATFAGDPFPPAALTELGLLAAGTGGDWFSIVSSNGLSVIHFDPLKYWPSNVDPFSDPAVYPWGGEAAGPAMVSDTFANQIGLGLDGVLNDVDLVVTTDAPQQGPEAAPPFIPVPFQNFHYLAAFDPADAVANSGLDWETWYVFFDWTPQGFRVVGLSTDSWAP